MIYSPSRHTLQENNSYLDTHFNVPKQSQENNSYLDTHFNVPKQSSIAFHVPRSKKTSEKTVEKPVIVIDNGEYMEEYSLKRKNVTLEGVDSFLLQLPNVKALDLSFNKLTALPRSLPYNICALDMSANPIRSLKCFINAPQAHHLIELKLCHNRISSMVGIGYAKSIEYLDLSDNNISMIEGIEPLVSLKSLLLKENRIATAMSIRALSLNTNLIELDLRNNPICAASVTPREYKILVQTMVPSLLKLDDEILTLKVPKGCYNSNKSEFITQGYCKIYEDKLANNKTVGYKVRYLSLQNHNANDIRVHNQMLDQYTTVKTIARSRKEKSTHNQEYVSVESSDSSLPWRKPPHPKPKDWPYTSNTDKKTPPATPATPLTATKSTVVLSASTTNSKKSSITKKPSQSQQWQSPSLHNRPAPVKVQEIPKPPLPIEIPDTAFDFVPPPLPYERDTVTAARTTSPLSSPKHSKYTASAHTTSPVSSPKRSKYTAYQPPSASPRRPPTSSQYSDVHQSSLNGIWLDEQDNYSTNNNLYAEYFDLHSDFDNNIEAVITTAPEAIQPRKVRINTTHVPLTPVMKQQDVDNYYKSQSPYGLLRSIQSKLLNLSHSPRNNVDNTMEELNFPPSYPIPRSNDDSGSIVLNGDIKEALLDLVQRKRNTLEILKSKH